MLDQTSCFEKHVNHSQGFGAFPRIVSVGEPQASGCFLRPRPGTALVRQETSAEMDLRHNLAPGVGRHFLVGKASILLPPPAENLT